VVGEIALSALTAYSTALLADVGGRVLKLISLPHDDVILSVVVQQLVGNTCNARKLSYHLSVHYVMAFGNVFVQKHHSKPSLYWSSLQSLIFSMITIGFEDFKEDKNIIRLQFLQHLKYSEFNVQSFLLDTSYITVY
jgi:hypothetical protein